MCLKRNEDLIYRRQEYRLSEVFTLKSSTSRPNWKQNFSVFVHLHWKTNQIIYVWLENDRNTYHIFQNFKGLLLNEAWITSSHQNSGLRLTSNSIVIIGSKSFNGRITPINSFFPLVEMRFTAEAVLIIAICTIASCILNLVFCICCQLSRRYLSELFQDLFWQYICNAEIECVPITEVSVGFC